MTAAETSEVFETSEVLNQLTRRFRVLSENT